MPFLIVMILGMTMLVWFIEIYEEILRQRNAVEKIRLQVDSHIHEETELVETLIENMDKEDNEIECLFQDVLKSRKKVLDSVDAEEKHTAAADLFQLISSLVIKGNTYFHLESDNKLASILAQITEIEKERINVIQSYNSAINKYNHTIDKFPNSIVARMFHLQELSHLEEKEQLPEKMDIIYSNRNINL